MEVIVPSRSTISERFPVASFMVRVPESRYFEVVCATDPRLFHTSYAGRRTPGNFYTSRNEGMLRSQQGDSTFFIPPQQLRRFAGARRIYYALGTYGGRNNESPRFSISPNALDQVPSIGVGADFTGRSLDRARVGLEPSAVYGSRDRSLLRWGGDAVLDAENAAAEAQSSSPEGYDDGYDADLWHSAERGAEAQTESEPVREADGEWSPSGLSWSEGAESSEPYQENPSGEYVGGFAGTGGYGAGESAAPGDGYAPFDQSFAADGGDEDAAQDSADSQPLGHEDGSEAFQHDDDAEAGQDSALSYLESDDLALDYGIDPNDAEDGAEHRAKQGQAASWETADVEPYALDAPLDDVDPGAPRDGAYGSPHTGAAFESEAFGDKEASYREEEAPEHSLPVGPAAVPLGGAQLEIAEKVRILRIIGRADSGTEAYSAVNADTEYNDPRHSAYRLSHIGLSWGFLMFTQRSGAIGRVLRKAAEREHAASGSPATALPVEQRLATLFGADVQALLRSCDPELTPDPEARVEPVGGKLLWEEPWLSRFRAAGRAPHIQAAQNEIGVVHYFDRMLPLARFLGLDTARALSLLVDRAVHMGVGSGQAWVMNAVGPIRSEADRHAALQALGYDRTDLRGFQRRQRDLVADGRWSAMTHAALVGALRRLGDRSPIAVPSRRALESALVGAARGTPFEARVKALADNTAELDDTTAFDLG